MYRIIRFKSKQSKILLKGFQKTQLRKTDDIKKFCSGLLHKILQTVYEHSFLNNCIQQLSKYFNTNFL